MKISAQMTFVIAAIFASVCLGVAIKGFVSIGDITDVQQAADAWGFAWFWAFLGVIGLVFGGVSWWLARTQKDE